MGEVSNSDLLRIEKKTREILSKTLNKKA